MATYNGAAFLAQQIDSILDQLGEEDELLVADDGSSDGTLELLQGYGERVVVTDTEPSGGVVANFERVLGRASGDVVLLSDQDDVWKPGRVARVCTLLEDADLVLVNADVVNAELEAIGTTLFDQLGRRRGFLPNLYRNTFVGCCMGFRRTLLERALPFPEGVPWHDWYLGLLAEGTGRVVCVEEPLGLYRRHGGNASATGEGSGRALSQRLGDRVRMLRCVAAARRRPAPAWTGRP